MKNWVSRIRAAIRNINRKKEAKQSDSSGPSLGPVKMEAAVPTESNPNPVAFPHIFGPLLPASCVTGQLEVRRDPADGTFLSIENICE